eukprot:CAMPEP_0206023020 /NCGR_PEP_ID=MMETSP1464-20131121/35734_1 /ASSEMBLY_ACC=CAM_ASM_001124 /TAXON_ID=119497 /ORGANISM="Exanthemachrysis gayraliae, Strain RCC1523" /LENGTH=147 /DNA_ID=CAMNT_0053396995 /DNA_START=6 /DNA_END=445 /DNA_ORIENTATION=-
MTLLPPLLLALGLLNTHTPKPLPGGSRRLRADSEALRLADAVIVDGDNVRGRTAFAWSGAELLARVEAWAADADVTSKVLLLFDHGDEADALVTRAGVAVAFSGPRAKADDVIADAVRWLTGPAGAVVSVATADVELRGRCEKGARA